MNNIIYSERANARLLNKIVHMRFKDLLTIKQIALKVGITEIRVRTFLNSYRQGRVAGKVGRPKVLPTDKENKIVEFINKSSASVAPTKTKIKKMVF